MSLFASNCDGLLRLCCILTLEDFVPLVLAVALLPLLLKICSLSPEWTFLQYVKNSIFGPEKIEYFAFCLSAYFCRFYKIFWNIAFFGTFWNIVYFFGTLRYRYVILPFTNSPKENS